MFSSQYANTNPESWSNYVGEINFRAKSGTRLFFMWIDSSKEESKLVSKPDSDSDSGSESRYYSFDSESNVLNVNLPHRPPHSEPGLGSFAKHFIDPSIAAKMRWVIDRTVNIDVPIIDQSLEISQYMKLINWLVLVKI